jgi:perosamine synthetase
MNTDIISLLFRKPGTISDALRVIDVNAQGVCFVTNASNKIAGVVTDGDIRRAFLKGATLDTNIEEVMNTHFVSASISDSAENINSILSDKIRHVPLVDENGVVVDCASRSRMRYIPIMQPSLNGNELAYVTDCIRTGWISSQGSYVKKFERMFSERCGLPFALATSNGTTALHLALVSLNIGPGDEVIVPDFTFAASINAVLYTGATPVLVDINKDDWTLDIEATKKAITSRTKAIMPVHIYGSPCDMDAILDLAKKHSIFIVEDCAEALGSSYKGKPVGTFGDVAAFSFFGNKTITTGEGGMLLFKDKKTYEYAAVLRDHGMSKERRYWHEHLGFNYRMTNMQAAIGVAQMERLDQIVERKMHLAQKYNTLLQTFEGLHTQNVSADGISSYWLYTLLVLPESSFSRDELAKKLAKNGIETRPAFFPLHHMPLYAPYQNNNDFFNSKFVSQHGISLPSYADITDEEIKDVAKAIKNAFAVKEFKS